MKRNIKFETEKNEGKFYVDVRKERLNKLYAWIFLCMIFIISKNIRNTFEFDAYTNKVMKFIYDTTTYKCPTLVLIISYV